MGPRKLAMLDVVVLAIVMESTILFELIAVRPSLSPVMEALAKSEAAILPAAISLPVICCKPILYLYYYSFIYVGLR
jgi:hypothetical protein